MIFESFDDVPRGHYGAIYEDPAWRFRAGKGSRSIERHYPTMTLPEIKALPIRDLGARDCHLFMWTTGPHLASAFDVLKARGFKYSSVAFVWIKLLRRHGAQETLFYDLESDFHMGTGYTTRANAEFCLLARRGKPKRHAKSIRQLCISPVREHSRKPDEIRDRIAAYVGDVPKLEMNARQEFAGWDQWGNEVQKFGAVA